MIFLGVATNHSLSPFVSQLQQEKRILKISSSISQLVGCFLSILLSLSFSLDFSLYFCSDTWSSNKLPLFSSQETSSPSLFLSYKKRILSISFPLSVQQHKTEKQQRKRKTKKRKEKLSLFLPLLVAEKSLFFLYSFSLS
jgi:hypothetical protein